MQPVTVRIPSVEIRDTAGNTLVTSIEILSPVNKREPGLTPYRQKRQRLYGSAVNQIELDLLRRGTRPFNHPRLPPVPYLISLTRSKTGVVELWPVELKWTQSTRQKSRKAKLQILLLRALALSAPLHQSTIPVNLIRRLII